MALVYLELHQGKLPRQLEGMRGADAYGADDPGGYWAVLRPEPPPGSVLAEFFAPEGPSDSAGAISHGNDSADASAQTVPISRVGIWRPKEPPYGFKVTSPDGVLIELDPPEAGNESLVQFAAQSIADGSGIWLVGVVLKNASTLPAVVDGRRAVLNLADRNFNQADFLHQPLLILDIGDAPTGGGSCPNVGDAIEVQGCAPGQVSFAADMSGDAADVEEVVWEFGDGAVDEQFDPPFAFPLTVTHNYTTLPAEPARVSVRRGAGCVPRTDHAEVDVPACQKPSCPSIRSLEVRGGCVPGQVGFRLRIDGAIGDVREITWAWGDGSVSVFDGGNLQDGLSPLHSYGDVPASDVSVAVRLDGSCRPGVISATVDLPACPDAPRCPTLDGFDVAGCAGGAGEVTFTATGQNLGQATSFQWDFGDGSSTTGGATATHGYAERTQHVVELTVMSARGCVPRQQTVTRTVQACAGNDDDDDGSAGGASLSCIILFVMFWVALLLTLVLLMVASCTLNPASTGLAIGVGLGTLLLLLLWLFLCGASACGLLVLAINLLSALAIGWPVTVTIIALFIPCVLLGGLIGAGFVGAILGIAVFVALGLGCLVQPQGGLIAGRRRSASTAAGRKPLGLAARLARRCEGCRKRASL